VLLTGIENPKTGVLICVLSTQFASCNHANSHEPLVSLISLLILGVVIGANNLATTLTLGALGEYPRRWKIIPIFGFFEFLVPLIGMWVGKELSDELADKGVWVAAALLATLGVTAIYSGWRGSSKDDVFSKRLTSLPGLVILAAGLSIDNAIVGFSLGLKNAEPLVVAATISIFAMAFSWLGLKLGNEATRKWERYTQIGAGALLLGLAVATAMGWF